MNSSAAPRPRAEKKTQTSSSSGTPPSTTTTQKTTDEYAVAVPKPKLQQISQDLEGIALPFIHVPRMKRLKQLQRQQQAQGQPLYDETFAVLPCLGLWTLEYRNVEFMVACPAETPVLLVRHAPEYEGNPHMSSMIPIQWDDDAALDELVPVAQQALDDQYNNNNKQQPKKKNKKNKTHHQSSSRNGLGTPEQQAAEFMSMSQEQRNDYGDQVKDKTHDPPPEQDDPFGAGDAGGGPSFSADAPTFQEPVKLLRTPECLTVTGRFADAQHPDQPDTSDMQEMMEQGDQIMNGTATNNKLNITNVKVRPLVEFTHKNTNYFVCKWMDSPFFISRKDASKPQAPRILLSVKEHESLLPIMERAEMELLSDEDMERLEKEVDQQQKEMTEERHVKAQK